MAATSAAMTKETQSVRYGKSCPQRVSYKNQHNQLRIVLAKIVLKDGNNALAPTPTRQAVAFYAGDISQRCIPSPNGGLTMKMQSFTGRLLDTTSTLALATAAFPRSVGHARERRGKQCNLFWRQHARLAGLPADLRLLHRRHRRHGSLDRRRPVLVQFQFYDTDPGPVANHLHSDIDGPRDVRRCRRR